MTTNLNTKIYILRYYADFRKDTRSSVFDVSPVNGDILNLDIKMHGTPGSLWENGEYDIQIIFPNSFPTNPPQIKFIPPIYHPNVKNDRNINLALLETSLWTKEISLIDILLSVQTLLDVPDENLIANSEANNAFLRYKEDNSNDEYVKRVKSCISKTKPDSTIDNPSFSSPVENSINQNHQNTSSGLSKPAGTFLPTNSGNSNNSDKLKVSASPHEISQNFVEYSSNSNIQKQTNVFKPVPSFSSNNQGSAKSNWGNKPSNASKPSNSTWGTGWGNNKSSGWGKSNSKGWGSKS